MADLTIGNVGIILQVSLKSVDNSQSPPVVIPLDLTNATVTLSFAITAPNSIPQVPQRQVSMNIVDAPNGIASYAFQSGDLAKPPIMGKQGQFRYSINVSYPNGNIFTSSEDVILTIKDDSTL